MSLLDLFKKNPSLGNGSNVPNSNLLDGQEMDHKKSNEESHLKRVESHEIPEKIFVEYENPARKNVPSAENSEAIHNLQSLYRFFEQNLERKGYEDALMNPDTSYMEEHVIYLQNEIRLLFSKVKTYYYGHIRTINFHIETRKRSGLIETVDELLSYKETIEEEIRIVTAFEAESLQNAGLSQNIILGYKRGFRNGFAAITYNTLLSRKN